MSQVSITEERGAFYRQQGTAAGALRSLWKFTRTKPLGAFGGLLILSVVLLALLADVVAPFGVNEQIFQDRFQSPNWTHIFGTDNLGRDLFTRSAFGARESLSIALSAAAINVMAATVLGLVSGYYGKTFDLVIQRFVDVWISMPGLLVIILFVSVFGPSKILIILLIGLVGAAATSRVVVGPDVIGTRGPAPPGRAVRQPQPPAPRRLRGHAQSLAAPEPLDPFVVHAPAFGPQQRRDAAVAVAPEALRQGDAARHEGGLIRGRAGRIVLRAPRLLQDATRPTLRDGQRGLHVAHRLAPVRWAQKFPEATSFRMALSSA